MTKPPRFTTKPELDDNRRPRLAQHPLVIAGFVTCRLCGARIGDYGIGTITALTMSVIDHRRECTAIAEESAA